MQVETIPGVYGRALLEAAVDKGALSEVAEEVDAFRKVLEDHPDIRMFIESPRLDSSRKREVIERTLRGKASDTFVSFLLLLVDKGREEFLQSTLDAFRKIHDDHIGLVRAEAVSAVALEESTLSSLRSKIESQLGKTVVLESKVDPEILGGLIVRFDGMVADSSIRTALTDLRTNMLSLKFGSNLVHEN